MVSRKNGFADGKYRSADCKTEGLSTAERLEKTFMDAERKNRIRTADGQEIHELNLKEDAVEIVRDVPGAEMKGDASTMLVANIMNTLMRPLLEDIGKMLKNNTEAMEQIAASQDSIRNRMEALEKQMRMQTPVTDRQAKYLADAARDKARELLDKKKITERKAINKLAGVIRKSVMARYGVGTLREIPRCEYSVAMSQIEIWNNVIAVMEIVREARERGGEGQISG